MNETSFLVLFSGRCLPGFEEDAVREQLIAQLRLTPHQVDAMFVGRAVVIKRKQSAEQAERLLARLRGLGMDVSSQAEAAAAASPAPAPTPATPPPAANGLALTPAEPVIQRASGERIGCYRCGVKVESPGFCPACLASNGSAPPTLLSIATDDASEPAYADTRFWGLSLDGRIGCLRYVFFVSLLFLAGQLSGAAIMMQAFATGFRDAGANAGIAAVLVLYLAILLIGLRLSILRLHDLNRSSYWLLGFIAVFGVLLGVGGVGAEVARTLLFWGVMLLMVLPGSDEANLYGEPDAPPQGWLGWMNLSPRIGRLRFAAYSGLTTVVVLLIAVLMFERLLGHAEYGGITAMMTAGVSLLSIVPTLFALTLVVALRLLTLRLRDLGLSGQWVVIFVVAVWLLNLVTGGLLQLFSIGSLIFGLELLLAGLLYLALMLIPGQPAANPFGEPEHHADARVLWLGIASLVLIALLAMWMSNLTKAAKHLIVTDELQRSGSSFGGDAAASVAERVAKQGWVVIFRGDDCPECDDIAKDFAAVKGDVLIYFCNVKQRGDAGVGCRAAMMEYSGGERLPMIASACGTLIDGYKPVEIKALIDSGTLLNCPDKITLPPNRAPLIYDVKTLGAAGLPPVTLYTSRDCEECDATREWLKRHEVPFSECNLSIGAGCNPKAPGGNRRRPVPEVWVGDYRTFASPQWLSEAFGFAPRVMAAAPAKSSGGGNFLKVIAVLALGILVVGWLRRPKPAEV